MNTRISLGMRWLVVLAAAFIGAALSTHCSSGDYRGLDQTPDAAAAACSNGARDGTESDVDCGGSCMNRCGIGKACNVSNDCASMTCSGGKCALPSCNDGVKNGTETDKDCGGDGCPKCALGAGCKVGSDCEELSCSVGGVCLAPSCMDGILNQGEKAADCAGPCPLCGAGTPCVDSGDCLSGVCSGTCQGDSCTDGVKNGAETGVDCGGGTCPKCAVGGACSDGVRDCQNGVCSSSICQAAHCTDSIKNGTETDKDCGGPDCAGCATGLACNVGTDCASLVCTGSVCQAPSCNPADMQKNGNETDVDCGGGGLVTDGCGGGTCNLRCVTGKTCRVGCDCASGVCQATPGPGLTCQAASCSDQTRNQDETDKDCGGSTCTQRCADGGVCIANSDCASGVCRGGICQVPTCQDVVKNGLPADLESDVDCGGMLSAMCGGSPGRCPRCDVSRSCSCGGDCQSGVCGVMNACPTPPCMCQSPTCPDTVKNQNETDTDCGGSNNCPRCAYNKDCALGSDCMDKVCGAGTNSLGNNCPTPPCKCQLPLCTDGVQNPLETDVDCGGSCAPGKKCANGQKCSGGGDCTSGNCAGGICVSVNTCGNACPKDACETDCNCGGCCGATCATNQNCSGPSDCVSGVCTSGKCQAPTCSDSVKNGTETDQDCGGTTCVSQGKKCADLKKCGVPADCQSGVCVSGICQAPSCPDGVQNGNETDMDCGKGSCSSSCCSLKCADTKKCILGTDCVNGVCGVNNSCPSPPCTCQPPTCSDTVQNQNESDVDCGGLCSAKCAVGQKCASGADCTTGACPSGTCTTYACNLANEFKSADNTSCYKKVTSLKTWTAALSNCQMWGGTLVTINSSTEQLFLSSRISDDTWIGLTDTGTVPTFHWVSGQPVTFTQWDSGEPYDPSTANCAAMSIRAGGDWLTDACSTTFESLCERGL